MTPKTAHALTKRERQIMDALYRLGRATGLRYLYVPTVPRHAARKTALNTWSTPSSAGLRAIVVERAAGRRSWCGRGRTGSFALGQLDGPAALERPPLP